MKYYRGIPLGLWFIAISNILFTIYYYIKPFFGISDVSVFAPMLTLTFWGFVMWFNTGLEIIGIYAVTVGFYKAKNWARLFTIFFFCFSAFWSFYFIFIERVWPYERYIWLCYYTFVIVYLLMSDVKEYFNN